MDLTRTLKCENDLLILSGWRWQDHSVPDIPNQRLRPICGGRFGQMFYRAGLLRPGASSILSPGHRVVFWCEPFSFIDLQDSRARFFNKKRCVWCKRNAAWSTRLEYTTTTARYCSLYHLSCTKEKVRLDPNNSTPIAYLPISGINTMKVDFWGRGCSFCGA